MKTISRILIILLAALVVVGVTLAVTNSSSTSQAAPDFQNGQPPQMDDTTFVPGERPDSGHDGDGGMAFGWLRHLVPISAIIFVVVILERLWGKIFKPRPVPAEIES